MMKYKNNKSIVVFIICGAMLIQGCSETANHYDSTENTLSTISIGDESNVETSNLISEATFNNAEDNLNNNRCFVEVNQEDRTFFITDSINGTNYCLEGILLTYGCPETANVYKIVPSEQEINLYDSPISEWDLITFQSTSLLLDVPVYNDDFTEYSQLTRSEIRDVLNSFIRLNANYNEQLNPIIEAYPNMMFGDYILRYTFPSINSDLYQISTFDTTIGEEIVLDTVIERSIDLYIIRQTLDGIPLDTPTDMDCFNVRYDDESKIETRILNGNWQMLYDGSNIYEVHTNENELDLYLENQPLLTFDQAVEAAIPTINSLLYDTENRDMETYIYAAELDYLIIQESDMSNINYYQADTIIRDNFDMYLYPFWVIYVHSNELDAGIECAYRNPILINAITGEVLRNN